MKWYTRIERNRVSVLLDSQKKCRTTLEKVSTTLGKEVCTPGPCLVRFLGHRQMRTKQKRTNEVNSIFTVLECC